jgi:hypothetical protein
LAHGKEAVRRTRLGPKYDEDEIEMECTRLEEAGLLTRFKGSLKRSVTSSIKPWLKVKAKEMGHKPSGVYYDLTKEGRKLAEKLIRAHRLSERLLTDIIGIDWIRAHEIAHRLELFIM